MLRLGQGGGPVVVVHDQVGCPTYTGHLAVGLVRLIDSEAFGIHHMAGKGSCSWYEFAMEIFSQSEVVTRVMASTQRHDGAPRDSDRPTPCWAAAATPRSALPAWQRGLADYLTRRDQPETEDPPRKRSSASRRQPVLDLHRKAEEPEEDEGAEAEEVPAEEVDEE